MKTGVPMKKNWVHNYRFPCCSGTNWTCKYLSIAHQVEIEIYKERGDLQGQPSTGYFAMSLAREILRAVASPYPAQYLLQTLATTTCHVACPWLHIVERGCEGVMSSSQTAMRKLCPEVNSPKMQTVRAATSKPESRKNRADILAYLPATSLFGFPMV